MLARFAQAPLIGTSCSLRAPATTSTEASSTGAQTRLIFESIALVALLASTWVVAGLALQGAGVGVVSAGRTGFAAFGLLMLVMVSHSSKTRGTSPDSADASSLTYTLWQLIVLSVTGVAGYTLLSTLAIELAGPAIPSLILALSPVVVLLLESALTGVRVRPLILLSTLLAVSGAACYVAPRLEGDAAPMLAGGVLAAVGAMLSMAIYGLYFAHVNRGYHGPMTPRILPIFALGSVTLVIWAAIDIAGGERVSLTTLVALGLGIYVPAYLVQHRVILTAGPSYAALLGLAVPPLVGSASAAIGLAALPTPLQFGGIALTLVGMFAVIRMKFHPVAAKTKE